MSEDIERWKRMAAAAITQRTGRDAKREHIISTLEPDWSQWTQQEREVYAVAFLYPAPLEPLIDKITIKGEEMNRRRYARTTRIVDPAGDVWLVVEHAKPERL